MIIHIFEFRVQNKNENLDPWRSRNMKKLRLNILDAIFL